ncbi:MAG TPA: methyltransferase domain-containing protein [Gammaproteobacteria bacterium]|nr:methyltransferase domain-containing protein [Gammaproteobacteria bacterium]
MSLFYRFQYLVGMTPWERMPSLPIGEQAVALLDREESGREPPYGRALDLGCGTGFWSVRLAQRGWEVTGVDIVPKAVRRARDRAREAGVGGLFVEGSVTALSAAGVGSRFRLILDFGVVHGLPPERVRAVGREVTAVATEDATLLMYAFSPGRRGPLPRGIGREEIEQAYGGWTITDEEAFELAGAPRFVQNAQPRFYCLRPRPS